MKHIFQKTTFRISILILAIHGLMWFGGIETFPAAYVQDVQNLFPGETDFWEMLFYFHGNPPLLSVINHFSASVSVLFGFRFDQILLPVLHCGAFFFFQKALVNFGFKRFRFISIVLFLNPLIFLYFKFPFYCTHLFFLNCLVLFLFSTPSIQNRILWLAAVFCVECLLRSTYQPVLFLALTIWLLPQKNLKSVCTSLAIFLPAFLWQFKNYMIVDSFTSSSWAGMNLARTHIPWFTHNDLVTYLPPFSKPAAYKELLQNESGMEPYLNEKRKFLSQENENNRIMVKASSLYIEAMKNDFSWTWSLNSCLNGALILFQSPANYENLNDALKQNQYGTWPRFTRDIFDINPWYERQYLILFFVSDDWDTDFKRWKALKLVTPYTILYVFLLVWFGFRFRKLNQIEQTIYLLTLFFSLVYASVDIFEANRMRMEYEPFFYFLIFKRFLPMTIPQNKT